MIPIRYPVSGIETKVLSFLVVDLATVGLMIEVGT